MKQYLTIKELTEAVKGQITPRMVPHYHTLDCYIPLRDRPLTTGFTPTKTCRNCKKYSSSNSQL